MVVCGSPACQRETHHWCDCLTRLQMFNFQNQMRDKSNRINSSNRFHLPHIRHISNPLLPQHCFTHRRHLFHCWIQVSTQWIQKERKEINYFNKWGEKSKNQSALFRAGGQWHRLENADVQIKCLCWDEQFQFGSRPAQKVRKEEVAARWRMSCQPASQLASQGEAGCLNWPRLQWPLCRERPSRMCLVGTTR